MSEYEPTEGNNPFDGPPIAPSPPPTLAKSDPHSRVWSAWVVPIVALVGGIGLSIVAVVILMFSNMTDEGPGAIDSIMEQMLTTTAGLLATILPGQISFLVPAVGAAILSPIAFRERLGLVKGTMPIWTWIVMGLATPVIAIASGTLIESTGWEMSESIKALEKMFTASSGARFGLLLVLVGILPGITEELLFRGYMLTRLLKNWPAWLAILCSALMFAVAHMDPIHSLGVFPLGLWLGFITWKSRSVVPAMIGHMANNLFAVIGTQIGDELTWESPFMLGTCILSAIAMLASIGICLRSSKAPAIIASSDDTIVG